MCSLKSGRTISRVATDEKGRDTGRILKNASAVLPILFAFQKFIKYFGDLFDADRFEDTVIHAGPY